MGTDDIALFDIDGTLADYDGALLRALNKIRGPNEPVFGELNRDDEPEYIKERRKLITNFKDWWATLPKFQLGWDVLGIARGLEYRIMVLTQGPKKIPEAWSGKKEWIDVNLGDVDVTITRDKGLVYGKVLVDDYPDYMDGWLKHRLRGLGIMPAHHYNKGYSHPNVIRYTGSNLEEVREAMARAKLRQSREPL